MWKRIPIFDGRYIINENGEIYNSVSNNKLFPSIFNNGYYNITLSFNGERRKFLVHRLVAELFIPNPYNLPIVMHLDNNKLNCNVSNLKWGTYSENNSQAIKDGLNFLPKPDNRKRYKLFNENSPVYISCNGVKEIIEKIGMGNDSRIRNYIFRKTCIPSGIYKNWKISLEDKRSTTIS